MPKELEDDKTGVSSDADKGIDQQGSQPNQDDNTASSAGGDKTASPAEQTEQGKKPASALEAAKAAIAADDARKTPLQSEDGKDQSARPTADADGEKEPTDDELEQGIDKLSDGAQKRIKTLSRRLREANAKIADVETQYKSGHENFERLTNFTRANNLAGEEVEQGLVIMALMKNNPAKALEVLRPHLENLNAFVGNTLPPDIQRSVDAGELTEAHGREIVRTRNEAKRQEGIATRERETRTTEVTQASMQQAATAMTGALNAYEQELRAANPDYEKMRTFYYDKVRIALVSDKPKSAAEARTVAESAWKATKEAFKGLGVSTPRPEIVPVRGDGRRSTPSNPAPAKTALEAARRAVGDA